MHTTFDNSSGKTLRNSFVVLQLFKVKLENKLRIIRGLRFNMHYLKYVAQQYINPIVQVKGKSEFISPTKSALVQFNF